VTRSTLRGRIGLDARPLVLTVSISIVNDEPIERIMWLW
jgi:hypothetical protein